MTNVANRCDIKAMNFAGTKTDALFIFIYLFFFQWFGFIYLRLLDVFGNF